MNRVIVHAVTYPMKEAVAQAMVEMGLAQNVQTDTRLRFFAINGDWMNFKDLAATCRAIEKCRDNFPGTRWELEFAKRDPDSGDFQTY